MTVRSQEGLSSCQGSPCPQGPSTLWGSFPLSVRPQGGTSISVTRWRTSSSAGSASKGPVAGPVAGTGGLAVDLPFFECGRASHGLNPPWVPPSVEASCFRLISQIPLSLRSISCP
uniref:Uncharacterized protein n=1 Tax=Amphimedon queenslandica TaxID=400682 RepID=A0A1X7V3M1_AMPQE